MREKRNLLSAFNAEAEVASQKEMALAQGEEASEMEGAQTLAELSDTERAGLAADAQVPDLFKLVYIDPFAFIDENWGNEEAKQKKAKIRAYIAQHQGEDAATFAEKFNAGEFDDDEDMDIMSLKHWTAEELEEILHERAQQNDVLAEDGAEQPEVSGGDGTMKLGTGVDMFDPLAAIQPEPPLVVEKEDITLEPPTRAQMDELQAFIQGLAHQDITRGTEWGSGGRAEKKRSGVKGANLKATASGKGKAPESQNTQAGKETARRLGTDEDGKFSRRGARLGHKREKVEYDPGKADEKRWKTANQIEREARERATKDAKRAQKAELQRQTRMAAERGAREAAHGPQGGAETSKQGGKMGKGAA
ncbi:hypothetical protein KFL_004920100 [Klebsormidium nitens]|uniref:Uncharacterized protein n=1 Tax=Klebsormidium nitens TaxID=105231 RepID=A0A1Y1IGH8_KLENI|nr:hypothetical protein KFL_004920100 [Klebsormidium nitens]|eukprot:GAQ89162.1 hypothetical protein KFL_004920100 [Klebsormidium nitens]